MIVKRLPALNGPFEFLNDGRLGSTDQGRHHPDSRQTRWRKAAFVKDFVEKARDAVPTHCRCGSVSLSE